MMLAFSSLVTSHNRCAVYGAAVFLSPPQSDNADAGGVYLLLTCRLHRGDVRQHEGKLHVGFTKIGCVLHIDEV